ncbi:hypothetical protein [Kitasatospora sp. MAP5-34]|uniref:hypothetical protein n=1 Tax=Kitasatospora sp. MAP5-34 TaxID=3035102 RepID=UPI0024747C2B|nr:hypothetical protein [Kitasatospora sp. MAP5-34]MDH6575295.1 hypothetical protein [Kitasatospora sp. MAP5-34]
MARLLHRRLVCDYETLPASAESMIYWSMGDNMTHRLTDTRALTWHDPPRAGGST